MYTTTTHHLNQQDIDIAEFNVRPTKYRRWEGLDNAMAMVRNAFGQWEHIEFFGVAITIDRTNIGQCFIDANLDNPGEFIVRQGGVHVNYNTWNQLSEKVAAWFVKQPEFQEQTEMARAIKKKHIDPVGSRKQWWEKAREFKINLVKKYEEQFRAITEVAIAKGQSFGGDETPEKTALHEQLLNEPGYSQWSLDHLFYIYRTEIAHLETR